MYAEQLERERLGKIKKAEYALAGAESTLEETKRKLEEKKLHVEGIPMKMKMANEKVALTKARLEEYERQFELAKKEVESACRELYAVFSDRNNSEESIRILRGDLCRAEEDLETTKEEHKKVLSSSTSSSSSTSVAPTT